ncbi:MAG: hypothetical protein OET21_12115, partial [Desulfobacterales bacterium]|nr:hypothetical protein [Desulfobacterales bacterium]
MKLRQNGTVSFLIRLAAFQTSGGARMKFRLPGTVKRLNVQHRTSNIDGFVKSLKTSFGVIPAKAGIQCFQIVLDACLRRHDGISDFLRVCQCSMFDVHFLVNPSDEITLS